MNKISESKVESPVKDEKSDEVLALRTAIRELMLAVEYMRSACEHAEGKRRCDRERLSRAMSVGIRINARYQHLLLDHQRESYWEEVWMMPSNVGLGPITKG